MIVEPFLRVMKEVLGRKIKCVSSMVFNFLMHYPWPGNVRQLCNVLEYAAVMSKSLAMSSLPGIKAGIESFIPHNIILGRLKTRDEMPVRKFIAGHAGLLDENFDVTSYFLVSSALTPKGPVHRVEAWYPLT